MFRCFGVRVWGKVVFQRRVPTFFFSSSSIRSQLDKCDQSHNALTLQWKTSPVPTTYHYMWLRDHCQCSLCIDKDSGQRLAQSRAHTPIPVPLKNPVIGDTSLAVDWSDGHSSSYPLDFLKTHNHQGTDQLPLEKADPLFASAKEWTVNSLQLQKFNYSNLLNPESRNDLIRAVGVDGLALIQGVPLESGKVAEVGSWFGQIRNTFYGEVFDVKSVPRAQNIAYTGSQLPYHQDLLYFESPPGLQLLHCLEFSDLYPQDQGSTTFADGLAIAQQLKEKNPNAYKLLSLIPVPYHYQAAGHQRRFTRPLLALEKIGPMQTGDHWEIGLGDAVDNRLEWSRMKGLNVSASWQGPLSLPFDLVEPFYAAYSEFVEIMKDEKFCLRLRLNPGELVVFNNRRMLHGREAYDPNIGPRHLQGTYVDADDFYNLYLQILPL